ncbi:integral membrane protein 2C isoform 5-T7 [Alca torda]
MLLFTSVGTTMCVLFKINNYDWSCLLSLPKMKSTVSVLPFLPQQVPFTELSWGIPVQFLFLPLVAFGNASHPTMEKLGEIKIVAFNFRRQKAYRREAAWRWPLWLYTCALPSLLVPGRACASLWGEGSQERKWDEEEETATAAPSDNVELLSSSSQQGGSGLKRTEEEEVVPAGRRGHGDGNASSEDPALLLVLFASAGLIPLSASERDGQENWLYQEQSSFVPQNSDGLGF